MWYIMNMMNDQNAINNLSKAYKIYFLASKDKDSVTDADEYAQKCTEEYVSYIKSCQKDYPHWTVDGMVKNEIRILMGLIECYTKRDFKIKPRTSNKTRWSL